MNQFLEEAEFVASWLFDGELHITSFCAMHRDIVQKY
jgi:hypothetical protein